MDLLDAPRTASGFADLSEGWWALIEQVCGDDLALLEECRARRADGLRLAAWVDAHRPPGTLDGKPLTPRPRYPEVEVPDEFPGWGPPSDHLHDGSEIHAHGEAGYRCLVCKDAGFVRHDVPFGHPNFGQIKACRCALENDTARAERVQTRLRRSGLPEELYGCTLETFLPRDGTLNGRRAMETWLEALRTGAEQPRWVALFGGTGAGKTHLLAAGVQTVLPLLGAFYAEQPDFLEDCKAQEFAEDERLTAHALNATVLVLDKVGAMRAKDTWGAEKVERILLHRYERRMFTLLGMEISLKELQAWSPRLASRLSDREVCLSVGLTGGDYRGQKGAE